MRKGVLFLFAIPLFVGINLSAQNPYIQHYTTVDGLPSNTVYHIYQDSKKFIWFATDAGASRYDGSQFTNYREEDGLSNNEVIRLKEDSLGRLWFFNLNATLNFFYQDEIFNETNAPFLDLKKNHEFFIDFFQDNDQTIYFYNSSGEIYALDRQNSVKIFNIHDNLLENLTGCSSWDAGYELRYINKASTGEFIFWTRCSIYKLNTISRNPTFFSDQYITLKVFSAENNSCYLLAFIQSDTILRLLKFDHEFLMTSYPSPAKSTYTEISSILEDHSGNLWISTFDQGVFCLKNNRVVRHFDIEEALALMEDHENNIWISSMKDGVYKISHYMNTHRHYENSFFQNTGIIELSPDIGNGVWCTNGKTIYLLKDNDFFTLDFQNEGSSFDQICQLKNNTLLIGQESKHHFAFEGIETEPKTKLVHYRNVSGYPNYFKKIVINNTEKELITFDQSTFYVSSPERLFRNWHKGFVGERIFNAFYNANNELIINAKKNYLYRNDSLVVCRELSCFNNKIITDHQILNDSTELYNIEGDRIFLFNQKKMVNLTSAFSDPIDFQIRKVIYHEPALYLSTSKNIYICNDPINILENKPIHIQLVDIGFRNIHDILFRNEALYIASDDGLTVIPVSELNKIETNIPKPYFQSILINDNETNTSEKIILTGKNRINFVFSSINYSSNPVIFSYKLEGADDEWTTGTGTNVVYQNLHKGIYVFKLRARRATSQWSEPIAFHIGIKATFWQFPAFWGFLIVLSGGGLFLLLIRVKNQKMKRREIEHQLIILEQKALQSMMNPHFIFNSLGSIQNYLLQNKPAEAGLYLSQFARLVRQNLNAINFPFISLEEEVDRLKNYLDLERLRTEYKFDYTIEIDESVEYEEILIPSMIIQPIVENSIWHGIASLDEKGLISIRFNIHTEASLKIVVEDNGIGMKRSEQYPSTSEKHLKLGMEMTRKRVALLGKKYNVETRIDFCEKSPGSPNPGTCALLIVPFISNDSPQ